MFKKRSRPTSVRDKVVEEKSDEVTDTPKTAGEEDEVAANVEELILLRKVRKAKQGINIDKLNRGEDKRKTKKKEPEIDFSKYGLHSQKKGEAPDEIADENERLKRLVRNNNFTQQTNALDVDKHMLAYIEREMEKRRGQAESAVANGKEPVAFDPQEELYRLAERYKLDKEEVKKDEEGDVTTSMGMLTSIPEVDLGMENRLKNIEETEKAKREMMEQRKANAAERAAKGPQEEDYGAARFFRGNRVVASDAYAMEDAKRQAAGLPPTQRAPRGDRNQEATDDQAYERFKKRIRR